MDEGLTMAHLKGTLDRFAEVMFGKGITTASGPTTSRSPSRPPRWTSSVSSAAAAQRPATRPAAPTDRRAGSSGAAAAWSSPRVLIACGVDPSRYSGFAFGMGIERTLMFRHNAEDMRDMVEGDVRFTLPFGMEI